MTTEKSHWAVDKNIPIATLVALFLQVGFFTFWVGGISKDIDYLKAATNERTNHLGRIIKLETEFKNIGKLLERIDRKLDNLRK